MSRNSETATEYVCLQLLDLLEALSADDRASALAFFHLVGGFVRPSVGLAISEDGRVQLTAVDTNGKSD